MFRTAQVSRPRALVVAMGAWLWGTAHAQVVPPEPATPRASSEATAQASQMPLPVTERDCMTSFLRDNTVKPEAGPYRVRADSHLPVAESTQQDSHVIEMAPPDGMRASAVVNGQASQTVSLGARTWVQVQGKWHALADVAPGATRERHRSYVDASGLRGLICLPPSEWEGKAVRSYRFAYPHGPGLARTLVRFDAATGLPLISDTQAATHPPITRRFEFDRSIHIEAPLLD